MLRFWSVLNLWMILGYVVFESPKLTIWGVCTQAAQASAEQQMAETMAQSFVTGGVGQFPYGFLGATPEQMQAFQHALAQSSVAPEMQHLLHSTANQVHATSSQNPFLQNLGCVQTLI
jgi:hypothetical protein